MQGLLSAGKLAMAGFAGKEVSTGVVDATVFYPAQADHQKYLVRRRRLTLSNPP